MPTAPRIGGMLIGYYLLCPRKAWLSLQGIYMEQESDAVALGRLLDEAAYARSAKHLLLEAEAPDGTLLAGRVDRASLGAGLLHETKKSRSCEEAHRWQLRFYLYLLHLNGVCLADGQPFAGQLDYPLLRRTESVRLTPPDIERLTHLIGALGQLAQQESPPPRLERRAFCASCSYEELCYG